MATKKRKASKSKKYNLKIQPVGSVGQAASAKRKALLAKLKNEAARRAKKVGSKFANVSKVIKASVTSQRAARAQKPLAGKGRSLLKSGRGNTLSSEHVRKQKALWSKKSRRSQLQHVKDHPKSSFPKRYGLKPR